MPCKALCPTCAFSLQAACAEALLRASYALSLLSIMLGAATVAELAPQWRQNLSAAAISCRQEEQRLSPQAAKADSFAAVSAAMAGEGVSFKATPVCANTSPWFAGCDCSACASAVRLTASASVARDCAFLPRDRR